MLQDIRDDLLEMVYGVFRTVAYAQSGEKAKIDPILKSIDNRLAIDFVRNRDSVCCLLQIYPCKLHNYLTKKGLCMPINLHFLQSLH